jgi:hypothetical protein
MARFSRVKGEEDAKAPMARRPPVRKVRIDTIMKDLFQGILENR